MRISCDVLKKICREPLTFQFPVRGVLMLRVDGSDLLWYGFWYRHQLRNNFEGSFVETIFTDVKELTSENLKNGGKSTDSFDCLHALQNFVMATRREFYRHHHHHHHHHCILNFCCCHDQCNDPQSLDHCYRVKEHDCKEDPTEESLIAYQSFNCHRTLGWEYLNTRTIIIGETYSLLSCCYKSLPRCSLQEHLLRDSPQSFDSWVALLYEITIMLRPLPSFSSIHHLAGWRLAVSWWHWPVPRQ